MISPVNKLKILYGFAILTLIVASIMIISDQLSLKHPDTPLQIQGCILTSEITEANPLIFGFQTYNCTLQNNNYTLKRTLFKSNEQAKKAYNAYIEGLDNTIPANTKTELEPFECKNKPGTYTYSEDTNPLIIYVDSTSKYFKETLITRDYNEILFIEGEAKPFDEENRHLLEFVTSEQLGCSKNP